MATLSWEFLSRAAEAGMTKGGIFPAIFGTVALVMLMTIAVIPLGVATAIYMHEYAPKRSRRCTSSARDPEPGGRAGDRFRTLRPRAFSSSSSGGAWIMLFTADGLVYGQPAILWAALTMALLTLPTVVVATEEALAPFRKAIAKSPTRWARRAGR